MATLLQRLRLMRIGWGKRESRVIQTRNADHSRQLIPRLLISRPMTRLWSIFEEA
jgi:hypothetical protein